MSRMRREENGAHIIYYDESGVAVITTELAKELELIVERSRKPL